MIFSCVSDTVYADDRFPDVNSNNNSNDGLSATIAHCIGKGMQGMNNRRDGNWDGLRKVKKNLAEVPHTIFISFIALVWVVDTNTWMIDRKLNSLLRINCFYISTSFYRNGNG